MGNAIVLMTEVAQSGNLHTAISKAFGPGFTGAVSQAGKVASPLLLWSFCSNKYLQAVVYSLLFFFAEKWDH